MTNDELANAIDALRPLAPLTPEQVAKLTAPGVLAASAQWYVATKGWAVFPCEPRGKRPLTQRGFHDASNNADVVASWWTRWPEANIGVPTGVAFDVVDIDAPDGFDTWARYIIRRSLPRPLAIARTGNGGQHRYYRPAVNSANGANLGKGVDYRGVGGYVILPPSRLASGGIYQWVTLP